MRIPIPIRVPIPAPIKQPRLSIRPRRTDGIMTDVIALAARVLVRRSAVEVVRGLNVTVGHERRMVSQGMAAPSNPRIYRLQAQARPNASDRSVYPII